MAGASDPVDGLIRAAAQIRELAQRRRPTGLSHDEADDVVGTLATDAALTFDPLPLLRALSDLPVVAIGQVAAILHGDTELTGDLDLLWDGDPAYAAGLARAFRATGAEVTDDDGGRLEVGEAAFALPKVLFSTPSACGDCCTPLLPWGGLDVRAFVGRAERAAGPDGLVVRYLALEDLIAMREAVGRPKDLRRAATLRALRG